MSDFNNSDPQATQGSETQSNAATAEKQAQGTESGDLSWIDSLGVEAAETTAPPAYAPQYDPQYTPHYDPRQRPPEYDQRYYPPQPTPQPSVGEDPEKLVNDFVKDPRGFIASVAEEIAERKAFEKMEPVVGRVARAIGSLRQGEVMRAREYAASRLREYASQDPDLSDPTVAREVNRTYSHFINNALRGDPEALAALQNPIAPQLVAQAAKASRSMRATLNRSAPVSYSGTRTDHTSTMSAPRSPGNVSNETAELARRWGISPDQWAENEKKAGG